MYNHDTFFAKSYWPKTLKQYMKHFFLPLKGLFCFSNYARLYGQLHFIIFI